MAPGGKRRGRKAKYPPAFYAKAAVIYEKAYLSGRAPIQAVARFLRLNPDQARGVVERTRKTGLLQQTNHRNGSGQATPEAKKLVGQRLPRIATDSRTQGVQATEPKSEP